MKTLFAAVLWRAMCFSTISLAQDKEQTIDQYRTYLESQLGADAMITSSEVFARKPDGSVVYIPYGVLLSTPWLSEARCPEADLIQIVPVLSNKYYWCYSQKPNYEARADLWVSSGGGSYVYQATSHFDCQVQADKNKLPTKTRQLAC